MDQQVKNHSSNLTRAKISQNLFFVASNLSRFGNYDYVLSCYVILFLPEVCLSVHNRPFMSCDAHLRKKNVPGNMTRTPGTSKSSSISLVAAKICTVYCTALKGQKVKRNERL
jgi:hypothetical protein